MLDRYFHDAQWVRKHWDLDVDFDSDSEGDATFGKYLSSDSLEKEESPVEAAFEQQPILDGEDGRVQEEAQDASEEVCKVLSEEAEVLAKEQQEVLADEEETDCVAEHEEISMEMREPDFSDRLIFDFGSSHDHVCVFCSWEAIWALYFFSLLLAFLCF